MIMGIYGYAHKVNSMIISPGSWVSDFVGNLRA